MWARRTYRSIRSWPWAQSAARLQFGPPVDSEVGWAQFPHPGRLMKNGSSRLTAEGGGASPATRAPNCGAAGLADDLDAPGRRPSKGAPGVAGSGEDTDDAAGQRRDLGDDLRDQVSGQRVSESRLTT